MITNNDIKNKWNISFIIPTLDAEQYIELVLDKINKSISPNYSYEIIVVDNGSTDLTREIARNMGAKVFIKTDVTISKLRNFGVYQSKGNLLIFLDADVFLTSQWAIEMLKVLQQLEKDERIITGSMYDIDENPTWIEKYWFSPIQKKKRHNYINSGHMIIKKSLFNELNGFDESLVTGEDYEFCTRAQKKGVKIINCDKLKTIHKGYPKKLSAFFSRERWLGRSDYFNSYVFLDSKPAILSILQLIFLVLCLILSLVLTKYYVILYYLGFLFIICAVSAFLRCSKISICFFISFFLYIIYFWARTIAFFDFLINYSYVKRK